MSETRPNDNAGSPLDDVRLAAMLDQIWRELDRLRAGLPNDEQHVDIFADLGEAQAALRRAEEKLDAIT